MKAEKRFLLAEKVFTGDAGAQRFRLRPRVSATFSGGALVSGHRLARLARSGDDHPSADGRLSADVRYIGLIGNLVWSSRPELAARRSRLVKQHSSDAAHLARRFADH